MWITVIVVCLMFPLVATPLNRMLDRRVHNRVLSYIVQFVVDSALLLVMCGIAHLLGFDLK